jgi:ATP-dependent helicase/nuclease subunit B
VAGVATIAAGEPFLEVLAEHLLARGDDRLAETLILLPSRRACLAARAAFLRVAEGRALLLPRLLPIGEPDEAELVLDPDIELELPPVLPPLRRRLLLTRLVLAREETAHEQAIRLAGELETLLDELQNEEIALDRLDALVPEQFAEHWQRTLRFLSILRETWPRILQAEGRLEPAERRRQLLDAVAARWRRRPPDRPVVAAGVTGTIPAVARLLAVVARLPTGLVVLPGLDRALSATERAALSPVHPQWALHRLLDRLQVHPDDVVELARSKSDRTAAAVGGRAALWRQVVRTPAGDATAVPSGHELRPEALDGLELVEARDLGEEALALAIRLREALETPERRAVLVTADRNLARRVAAELARWGIAVDDSAGTPLDQTPPGTFLLLTARVLVEDAPPVPLLAALGHPLAQGGLGRREFRRRVRALERAVLRGPRTAGGLEGLLRALRALPEEGWTVPVAKDELVDWFAAIVRASAPARALAARAKVDPLALFEAHLGFAEWLARDEAGEPGALWAAEAGEAAAAFVAELREALPDLGPIPPSAWPALLAVLMAGRAVRRRAPGHPRLAILGPLESRLVSADLVCVGGLVEGVWPGAVESGPWLDRRMRAALGLPPVEQAIGIAAHDFVQAASGPTVLLSRSQKDETGTPRTPSRWLVRLEAVLARARARDRIRPAAARAAWPARLDEPVGPWPRPTPRPAPRPPAEVRPREFWVSDVRDLLRDPYRLYARRILALEPMDPIDAEPGAPERGVLLHRVLAEWVRRYRDVLPENFVEALRTIGAERFASETHHPQIRALWWPRFEQLAPAFARWESERRRKAARIWAELTGELTIDGPAGRFRIRARADRIELGRDGRLAIVDYKSGSLPEKRDVESGREPQLVLEAWIAAEGGFPEVPAELAAELVYLSLRTSGGTNPTTEPRRFTNTDELVRAARDGVSRLLAHFADPATAFRPIPRPEIARGDDPFDHLARSAEWWGTETSEVEP